MAIHLYATMTALPGSEAVVAGLLTALASHVRAEPGNLRFVVYHLADDPASFHIEESYRDRAAFETHIATDHGRTFNAAIATLVAGGASRVVMLHPVGDRTTG